MDICITLFDVRPARKLYYQNMSYFVLRHLFLDLFTICGPISKLFEIWIISWMVVMWVEGILNKLPGNFLKLEMKKNETKLIIKQFWSPKVLISWYIHYLWIDFKMIRNFSNFVDSCYTGWRNFEETSRKLPKIKNIITNMTSNT